MKKTNPKTRQEITAQMISLMSDYLEDSFSTFMGDFMQASSGVYTGLGITQSGASGFSIATGGIFQYNKFGGLESASGMTVTLPTSGTRTDLVVAYYEEVLDMPGSGYILVDVETREEQIQTNPQRRFGACRLGVLQNTTYATRPANRVPLYELSLSTSTITSISDVRTYAAIQRFVTDIEQDWMGLFYSGF
jgi:hypothetical protein